MASRIPTPLPHKHLWQVRMPSIAPFWRACTTVAEHTMIWRITVRGCSSGPSRLPSSAANIRSPPQHAASTGRRSSPPSPSSPCPATTCHDTCRCRCGTGRPGDRRAPLQKGEPKFLTRARTGLGVPLRAAFIGAPTKRASPLFPAHAIMQPGVEACAGGVNVAGGPG